MSLTVARPSSLTSTAITTAAGITALAGGVASVLRPAAALVAVVLVVGLAAMVLNIERALLAYVALEPFGDLANTLAPGAVKAVGLLLFLAWAARLVIDHRPVARHPAMVALAALGLILLASTAASGGNGGEGLPVLLRYLSYLAVLVVVLDTVRDPDRAVAAAKALRLLFVYVLACTAAGVVGLLGLLATDGGRAGGPMEDPNDFAFFLISAVPFAVVLAAGSLCRRLLFGAAAVVLVTATAATFSRGAGLGLCVIVVVALALRLIRPRQLVLAALAILIAGGGVALAAHDVISRSIAEKEHVAEANIDSRYLSWSIAAEMTADRPLLGHGPAGYGLLAPGLAPESATDTTHLDVAHQMYLDVSSELGIPGLLAFLALIGAGLRGALRARRAPVPDAPVTVALGGAVVTSLAGVLVAACFLSEQFYLPIWLLAGLGMALDPPVSLSRRT